VYHAVEEEDLSSLSGAIITVYVLSQRVLKTMIASLTQQLAQAIAQEVHKERYTPNGYFTLPQGWKVVTETRRNGKSAGKKFKNFYSPSGKHFRSAKQVHEHLMFETSGLPVGWKRVKQGDTIIFSGPEGQSFEHIYQVFEVEAKKQKIRFDSDSEPEPEPEPEPAQPEPEPEPEPAQPELVPEPEPAQPAQLEPLRMTKQGYFIHAVCGLEPSEPDELWMCYVEFLDFLSGVLCTDFNIGTDIVKLKAKICIPSDYRKKFAQLVKRLSKYGGKLRFRISKNRRANGYYVKDAVDLFKRLTDVIFPQTGGYNMFVMKTPQKGCVRVNGNRVQHYMYTFVWKGIKDNIARFHIPNECVIKSLQD